MLADLGCLLMGVTVVPIYDTLGQKAIEFIVDQTSMKVCFVTYKNALKLLESKRGQGLGSLETIVILD